jgi:hypothetical protein
MGWKDSAFGLDSREPFDASEKVGSTVWDLVFVSEVKEL